MNGDGPRWQVVGVMPTPDDPAEVTPFFYTVGLYDLGLPELHLNPMTSVGHMVFDVPTCQWLLNTLGNEMWKGLLVPGGTWAVVTEAGVTLTFTVGQPSRAARRPLECYITDEAAAVSSVTWEEVVNPVTEARRAIRKQGPCAFCGLPWAAHRRIDSQMEHVVAGDPIEFVAQEYETTIIDMVADWTALMDLMTRRITELEERAIEKEWGDG